MRKVMVVGAVVVIVLSLAITGTIFAQGGGPGRGGNSGAWLGISLEETGGVLVSEVTDGSPAAEAGLQAGDVITSVDGETVNSVQALIALIRTHQPGDTISLTVTRDGSEVTLEVTLGTVAGPDGITIAADPLKAAERVLRVQLEETDEGYQVVSVGRMNTDGGLEVDDIITAVNGTAIAEVDWQTVLTPAEGEDTVTLTLTVLRDGAETEVTIDQFGGMGGNQPGMNNPGGMGGQPGMGQPGGMGGQPGMGQPGGNGGQPGSGTPQDANPVVPDNSSPDSFSA